MSLSLPPRPDFTQLKHQAKDLLRAHERKDPAACDVLRRLRRFADANNADILAQPLKLHEAQYALAMEYGFTSWNAMKRFVENLMGVQSNPKVHHESGKVWIEGLPQLRWGQSGECSFAGALSALLSITDRPVSYSDLMGASGLAFRVRWYRRFDQPDWCPSSPVGEFSQEILAVTDAVGWRIHQESRMASNEKDMSTYAQDICKSIDVAHAVVGYPDEDLNVAVCYGYERSDDETIFLWNAYGRDTLRVPASKVGPWLLFLDEPIEPMSPQTLLKQALSTTNWRRKRLPSWNAKPEWNVVYLYGQDALQQWQNDIKQADHFSPEQQRKLFFVSWWCIDCLVDARISAATFLRDHLDDVSDTVREHLSKAAEAYSRLTSLVGKETFEYKNCFLGPWTGKKFEDWTAEARQREQEVLAQIASLDAAAITEIDKALPDMDSEP